MPAKRFNEADIDFNAMDGELAKLVPPKLSLTDVLDRLRKRLSETHPVRPRLDRGLPSVFDLSVSDVNDTDLADARTIGVGAFHIDRVERQHARLSPPATCMTGALSPPTRPGRVARLACRSKGCWAAVRSELSSVPVAPSCSRPTKMSVSLPSSSTFR